MVGVSSIWSSFDYYFTVITSMLVMTEVSYIASDVCAIGLLPRFGCPQVLNDSIPSFDSVPNRGRVESERPGPRMWTDLDGPNGTCTYVLSMIEFWQHSASEGENLCEPVRFAGFPLPLPKLLSTNL